MNRKKESLIWILLADDHNVVRKGLASLLAQEPDFVIVGEAENGNDAVLLASRLVPNVVVMDISMHGLNGIEAARRIKETLPHIRIIILSMHINKMYVQQALRAGASGYVLKSDDPKVLVDAIRQVHQGKGFLSPDISKVVIEDYIQHMSELEEKKGEGIPLSSREREVLQQIAEGKRAKEIAITLSLSVKTVENHRKNIMHKLDIHNTAGLVQFAIQNNIISLESTGYEN
jgi:DNA-binding NarL/FixJ family response regulator